MTTERLLLLAGAAGLGYLLWKAQAAPVPGAQLVWRSPFSTSDGTQTPAQGGVARANQAGGWMVPGGGSSIWTAPIAPQLWALGGSPSGWNEGAALGAQSGVTYSADYF